MPQPLSEMLYEHILAGRDIGQAARAAAMLRTVLRISTRNVPPARHGVARIQGQVEDHVFHLAGVDKHVPRRRHRGGIQWRSLRPGRALEQVIAVTQDAQGLDRDRLQWLAAGKGQQLRRQLGAPRHGSGHTFQTLLAAPPAVGENCCKQLDIAINNLQHIIKIVGNSARQFAHRFQLLCMIARPGALLPAPASARRRCVRRPCVSETSRIKALTANRIRLPESRPPPARPAAGGPNGAGPSLPPHC